MSDFDDWRRGGIVMLNFLDSMGDEPISCSEAADFFREMVKLRARCRMSALARLQRHSNFMLAMRRIMGVVGECLFDAEYGYDLNGVRQIVTREIGPGLHRVAFGSPVSIERRCYPVETD